MPYKDPEVRRAKARVYSANFAVRNPGYGKVKRLINPERYRTITKKAVARYNAAHPDRVKESQHKYKSNNREKQRISGADWRRRNQDKVRANSLKRKDTRNDAIRASERAWRDRNKDRVRIMDKNKRAKRAGAVGRCTKAQWEARCTLYGWCCAYCGEGLTKKTVQTEHVIPLARGGTNWPANLVPACRPCNNKKGVKRIRPRLPRSPSGQSPPSFTSTGAVAES